MRQAQDLLYGSRRAQMSEKGLLLRQAEQEFRDQGQTGLIEKYLIRYPSDVLHNKQLDPLLLALIATEAKGDSLDPKSSPSFRRSVNSRGIIEEFANSYMGDERQQLSQILADYPGDLTLGQHLSDQLFTASTRGPLALTALAAADFNQQLKIFYRCWRQEEKRVFDYETDPISVIDLLKKHLAWRLVAEIEKPVRLLAKSLNLIDEHHPSVGELNGKLHYLADNEYTLCDPDLALPRAQRGAWRDYPERRCSKCLNLLDNQPLEPASDDPDYYTILDEENYYQSLYQMSSLLTEKAERYQAGVDADELVGDTLVEASDYAQTHRWMIDAHKAVIAETFADQFNHADSRFRDYYLNQVSQELTLSQLPLLTSDEVGRWLDIAIADYHWLDVNQVNLTINRQLEIWLASHR